MKMNLLDRAIYAVAPEYGRKRLESRIKTEAALAFDGASQSRPALKSWRTSKGDADGDINASLPELRSRSRDLERNNPLAHGAMKTKTTYVIGTGLRPEPNIDAEFLGLSPEQAKELQHQIWREFNLVAESVEADAARRKNFYRKQAELFHSSRVNGDAFLLLPFFKRGNWPYHTRFMSVESDRICNPANKADSEHLSGGFELDDNGAVTKLHILKTHPGKRLVKRKSDWETVKVFGKDGERNVLILSNNNLRASQTRGIPDLAPVIEVIKQCGRYIDAELMASVISSKFTVFIKSDAPTAGTPFAPGTFSAGGSAGGSDDDSDDVPRDLRLGDGLVMELDEGESIETANPGRPNAQFDPFVTALWRLIGGALGIPLELLMKHFTASYSASKAALLQFAHYILVDRAEFVTDVCQPYYEAVLAEAVARGRLHMPGFFKDPLVRKAYCRALWHGPIMGDIDESKAATAAEKRLKIGISTHELETRRLVGQSWDQINSRRIIEEQDKWREPEPTPTNPA